MGRPGIWPAEPHPLLREGAVTPGAVVFLVVGFAFALGILALVWWMTRLPRCPQCGGRKWVACPHLGRYSAYCRRCLLQVDFSRWEKP